MITVGGYELDYEQLEAATSESSNVLVVAGAGSGKTTTIVGKIKYMFENGINSSDILCISFTNASVSSLHDKILKETGSNIEVYTFHKLSMNIIENNKLEYKLSRPDLLEYLVDEYFNSLIYDDINIMYTYLKYLSVFNLKINVLKRYKKNFNNSISNLIIKFIRLMKTNGYTIYDFNKFKKRRYSKDFYLLKLILIIYQYYMDELESNNELDFDDLIIKATDIINNGGLIHNYKCIIIDEFQDSSFVRFNLIRSIQNRTKSKLFVVGDDFQSIYKFAGCNLNIMLDFNKYPNTKIYNITNTYRNSQELIDIAGSFVMKNKRQIPKKLKSNIHLDNPIVIVRYKNYKSDFKKLLKKINVKNSILILGRYNKDIYKILDKDYNVSSGLSIEYIPMKRKMKYMTVHKSKGLEEDVVIIINLTDDKMGFPSKLEDDKILNLVSPRVDKYPYSEERRLFYVALTRTKSYVYLYTPMTNESTFVNELKRIGHIKDIKL